MIDGIRNQIQERLDQLLAESDKLRRALAALDPRDSSLSGRAPGRPRASRVSTSRSAAASATPADGAAPAPTTAAAGAARARTAPGATRQAVIAALDTEKALTAGEVAAATGLARATVSTTLSKLATSGEILKAERGYQLARNGKTAAAVK